MPQTACDEPMCPKLVNFGAPYWQKKTMCIIIINNLSLSNDWTWTEKRHCPLKNRISLNAQNRPQRKFQGKSTPPRDGRLAQCQSCLQKTGLTTEKLIPQILSEVRETSFPRRQCCEGAEFCIHVWSLRSLKWFCAHWLLTYMHAHNTLPPFGREGEECCAHAFVKCRVSSVP